MVRALGDQLERDRLETVLDQGGDLARVRAWDLVERIGLPDDERVLDVAEKVLGFAEDGTPAIEE